MEILKVAFLFFAILLSIVNVSKTAYREHVSAKNFLCQAVGITGFVYLQFLV